MRASLLALAVAGCLVVAGCSGDPTTRAESPVTSPSSGVSNPVIAMNMPDPQVIADPAGGYVLFATNGNGMNVQTAISDDLFHWSQGQDALPAVAAWSTPGKVWAPEAIAWGDGDHRLYYTTRAPRPDIQCVSVAVGTSAAGPYTDASTQPIVCEEKIGGSIDASPYVAPDGTRYLYWKNDGNAVGEDTWISVAKLSADGLSLAGTPTKLIKQTEPWEGQLVEAPFVWEHEGTYHLFYSANSFADERYAVGHATASSPTGPFTKDADPIVVSNDVAAGPGHCALIEVKGQIWMVYHAWAPDGIGDEATGRQVWLSKVSFDGTRVRVDPPTSPLVP